MRLLAFCFAFPVVALGGCDSGNATSDAGSTPDAGEVQAACPSALIGGAEDNAFPAVGAIVRRVQDRLLEGCTAALIDCRERNGARVGHVLTAAHCVREGASVLFAPRIPGHGEPLEAAGSAIPVTRWTIHPTYFKVGWRYTAEEETATAAFVWDDVAVGELASCPAGVAPLPLVDESTPLSVGDAVTAVGFGLAGPSPHEECVAALEPWCRGEEPYPNDQEFEDCVREYDACLPPSCRLPDECWEDEPPASCTDPLDICTHDYAFPTIGPRRSGEIRVSALYQRAIATGPDAISPAPGDSGGPLLVPHRCGHAIAGVFSWSSDTSARTSGTVGLYARVREYLGFIRAAVEGRDWGTIEPASCNPRARAASWAECSEDLRSLTEAERCRVAPIEPPTAQELALANCDADGSCTSPCGLGDPDCALVECGSIAGF